MSLMRLCRMVDRSGPSKGRGAENSVGSASGGASDRDVCERRLQDCDPCGTVTACESRRMSQSKMSEQLRLADLLGGLSIVSGLPPAALQPESGWARSCSCNATCCTSGSALSNTLQDRRTSSRVSTRAALALVRCASARRSKFCRAFAQEEFDPHRTRRCGAAAESRIEDVSLRRLLWCGRPA